MLHLVTASAILACLVWVAAGVRPERSAADPATTARPGAFASLLFAILVLFQIALGALVAGSKAGFTYNTWPLMDGSLVPPASALFSVSPLIENFVDNLVLVQFNHRLVAYVIVAFGLWQAWRTWRLAPATGAARRATALAGLALAQMGLGIVTLLLVVPLWAGLMHQVFAMVVLAMAVVHARLTRDELRAARGWAAS
jgi:cytochrome c oxidase assembly protein subunit 15